MKTVSSRYKIFGGFGLLIVLNGFVGILTYMGLEKLTRVGLSTDRGALLVYAVVLGLQALLLVLFATQNRYIVADSVTITLINPLIPLFRKTYLWSEFDYYLVVLENSRYDVHEAVWLVRGRKMKVRFSSFYYSNFDDLVDQIRTPKGPNKAFGLFDQLFILLGIQKVE